MVIQLLANSLTEASVYVLIAVGFSVIYNTVRFFNFAHGIVYTTGAYAAYAVTVTYGNGWWLGLFCGVILASALGCVFEIFIYRRMRRTGSSSLVLFIASLGLLVGIQNIISLVYGDGALILRREAVNRVFEVFGARVTQTQAERLVIAIILCLSVWLFLKLSSLGRRIRAVANDPDLAKIVGVNTEGVILFVFAAGSALAGLAAILLAQDTNLHPNMGLHVLLMAVVAIVVGGGSSIPGIALGACLVSVLRNMAIWLLPAQWGDAIVFVLLIPFLLYRPQGFLGQPIRRVEV